MDDTTAHTSRRQLYTLVFTAGAILLITMGVRQTSGLFLIPITQSTGVSVVAMSFALAVGQLMWGATQPIFGAIADKYGAVKVVIAGAILLALGNALTPFAASDIGLIATMGVLSAAGAGAGSFSILIGIAAQRLPPEKRSFAAGVINAGGSIGQSVFAPLVQLIIGAAGWASAMFATAFVAPLSLMLIGLFNVAGSLAAGWLGQRYRMKYLLALIYASRALIVAIYVVMPKTALNVYMFAGALGFTWLATVPPTSGLVGKLFGTRYLATLFGLTLLSHQIGGFLGAWLGGVALAQTGNYEWIWYADITLALLAAAANLPIREARLTAQPVTA
jgi:MFS family permease